MLIFRLDIEAQIECLSLLVSEEYYVYSFSSASGKPVEFYRGQLGAFGVSGELALRPVISLSGGQKSRVAFALLSMSK